MSTLEIILLITSLSLLALYVRSKIGKSQDLNKVIKEVKPDLKNTAGNVYKLVNRATEIVFDESIQKTIKEFIMIVEEKNQIAKQKGEDFLAGDEKKLAVISRFSKCISNISGSTEKAVDFIETNQSRIELIIDDYVSFSNKMQGKETLSKAEKIIANKLRNTND